MEPSNKFFALVKRFEGFSSLPYQDQAGVWTIGYGSTYDIDGNKITKSYPEITEEQAEQLVLSHIKNDIITLNKIITSDIIQNQFDAVLDFVYNLGIGNFQKSSLLKYINIDPYADQIEDCFMRWTLVKVNGTLIKSRGLERRREAEVELYFEE